MSFFHWTVARQIERLLLFTLLLSLVATSEPTGAVASNPNDDPRLSQAVNWATQQMATPRLWLEDGVTLCDKFVENAFGVTAQYPTAYDMYLALGKSGDPVRHSLVGLQQAPVGAIVFFDRNAGNWNDGHVGIFVGNDQFMSVVTGGRIKQHSAQWWNDHISHFLGWAYPRADWPGYGKSKSVARIAPPAPSPQALDAATHVFKAQWQMGEGSARNLWGPSLAAPEQESYRDALGGERLVQYYDKGRMELDDAKGGTVTNGLLATELITGEIQVGDTAFQSRGPAAIPIAGDPDTPGPTYAAFADRAAKLLAPTPSKTGTAIGASLSAAGDVSEASATNATDVRNAAKADTTLSTYDGATKHNLPAAFAAYRARIGFGVIGYAKSEPFVTTVKVAGVSRQVVVQVFERRVLTYNAANSDVFKVEMGNIGQHYRRWRYQE